MRAHDVTRFSLPLCLLVLTAAVVVSAPGAQRNTPAPSAATPSAVGPSPGPGDEAQIPLDPDDQATPTGVRSSGYYLVRSLISLLIVVGVIYATALLLREIRRRPLIGRRDGAIQLIESAPIGPGQMLHLVCVCGRLLLLGATPQGIRVLKDIGTAQEALVATPQAAPDAGKEAEPQPP